MFKAFTTVSLALIILLVGCSDQKRIQQLEEKHTQLETEYQLLLDKAETNNRFIEEYTGTLSEVYSSLEKIRVREGYLVKASRDVETNGNASLQSRKQMLSDINSIDDDLKKSKRKLASLREKLKSSELKTSSLTAVVDSLTKSFETKEAEVQTLRIELGLLDEQIAKVESELLLKDQEIVDQRRILETTYYVIGTTKELKEKGIIEEKGGFLGINKTKKLASSFNRDHFIPMDIGKTTIPILQNVKKVNIISPHNPASYSLNPTSDSETTLEITNSDEFWKIKYLVIEAKG